MVTQKPKRAHKKPSRAKKAAEPTLAEQIAAIGRTIAPNELRDYPPDFTENLHHYMHGHRRQSDPKN